jgi:hypothetical protein
MEPIALLYERGRFVLVHRCTACGHDQRTRSSPGDDLSPLL